MAPPRVAVLDYGAGNLRSAQKALERAGARAQVVSDPSAARHGDALVIPGVGHFGQCVRQFRAGFAGLVEDWVTAGRPVLGICVGLQILYEHSDESPDEPGLGILPGAVRRLPGGLVVPHMGWNVLQVVQEDPVIAGVDAAHVYFVHSYRADPADDRHVLATCTYGEVTFPAVVRLGNVWGTQFHPEKSAAVGERILSNWVLAVSQAVVTA